MNAGYHAIFVGITTGTLVFAFVALTYRMWFRPRNNGAAHAVWKVADLVALYAALAGTIILALAIGSGLLLRPIEAYLNSPITKNKMLTAFLALLCWSGYLALRIKSGPSLWRSGFTSHVAYVLSLAGFIFLVTTNSIGGDIAGIPSGYERFAEALGFRTRHALYFPTWLNVWLWVFGAAGLVGGIAAAVLRRRRDSQQALTRPELKRHARNENNGAEQTVPRIDAPSEEALNRG